MDQKWHRKDKWNHHNGLGAEHAALDSGKQTKMRDGRGGCHGRIINRHAAKPQEQKTAENRRDLNACRLVETRQESVSRRQ